jgi:hypothetical protein
MADPPENVHFSAHLLSLGEKKKKKKKGGYYGFNTQGPETSLNDNV